MSAPQYRAALQQRITELLFGETGGGGVMATISGLNGGLVPKDYPQYRDLVGYVRGLTTVLNVVIPETYRDLFEIPVTEDQKKPRNVLDEGGTSA